MRGTPTVRTVWHSGSRSRISDSPSLYGPDRIGVATDHEDLGDPVFVESCRDLLDVFAALDQPGGDVRHGVVAGTVQLGAELEGRLDALGR